MPLYAVDKNGRVYQTDPNFSDGRGYKGPVPKSGMGDVTPDNSYANFEQAREMEALTRGANNRKMDKIDEHNRKLAKMRKLKNDKMGEIEMLKRDDMMHQEKLIKSALLSGQNLTYDYVNPLRNGKSEGNSLTFNGMYGTMGMTDNEKAVAAAAVGASTQFAYRVDPMELAQQKLNEKALAQIMTEARKKALVNELEVRQANLDSQLRKKANKTQTATRTTLIHPLLLMLQKG